jgi:hypothetical protein
MASGHDRYAGLRMTSRALCVGQFENQVIHSTKYATMDLPLPFESLERPKGGLCQNLTP